MMKSIKMAALIISMAGIVAAGAGNVAASSRKYVNGYKGIFTGVSSLQDVCKELGVPVRIEEVSNRNNYIFKEVTVNFSGKDKEKVNTIIIDNDYDYMDANGIKVGDMVNEAEEKIKGRRYSSTITDEKKRNSLLA